MHMLCELYTYTLAAATVSTVPLCKKNKAFHACLSSKSVVVESLKKRERQNQHFCARKK